MVEQKIQSYGTLKSWYVKRIPENGVVPVQKGEGDELGDQKHEREKRIRVGEGKRA